MRCTEMHCSNLVRVNTHDTGRLEAKCMRCGENQEMYRLGQTRAAGGPDALEERHHLLHTLEGPTTAEWGAKP